MVKNTMPAPIMSDEYHFHNEWKAWYAWYPRRINGKWWWRETVYRRFRLSPGGGFWQYGDMFDVLNS